MRVLTALLGASVLLGGCGSVPPSVNPTVEVWNVQPTADTDLADVIVEEVVSLASNLAEATLDTTNYSSGETSSGCWFWCFRGRATRSASVDFQPIVAQPVAYYPVHVSNPAQSPAIKPTPRPVHVATPKPQLAREHAPRHMTHTPAPKPSTPKQSSKPAATSKSNTKKDKR